jgi:hypothetical protein
MRVVVIFIAALFTLGLAAFGVVAAQRGNAPILANLFQPHALRPQPWFRKRRLHSRRFASTIRTGHSSRAGNNNSL